MRIPHKRTMARATEGSGTAVVVSVAFTLAFVASNPLTKVSVFDAKFDASPVLLTTMLRTFTPPRLNPDVIVPEVVSLNANGWSPDVSVKANAPTPVKPLRFAFPITAPFSSKTPRSFANKPEKSSVADAVSDGTKNELVATQNPLKAAKLPPGRNIPVLVALDVGLISPGPLAFT